MSYITTTGASKTAMSNGRSGDQYGLWVGFAAGVLAFARVLAMFGSVIKMKVR